MQDHLSETMYGEDGMGPLQSLIHERLYGGNGSPAYREATDKMLDFLLIRAGISLHSLDKKGRNILHTVAGMPAPPPPTSHASSETDYRYKSWMHLVEQLIAKGICRGGAVNVREKENGNAPLHECASKGNDLLLSILCKHGGNVLLRNTNGSYRQLLGSHPLTQNDASPLQGKHRYTWHAERVTSRQLS